MCQCVGNFFKGVLGVLSFLLVLIFLGLYCLLYFLFWLFTCGTICCKTTANKSREYYIGDGAPCCVKCCPCLRKHFGEGRLRLLTTPPDKRGCCWHIRDAFIGTYQMIQFLLGGGISSPYLNMALADDFGDRFPFVDIIAVGDTKSINYYLDDPDIPRGNYLFGLLGQAFADYNPDNPIFQGTGTLKWRCARQSSFAWLYTNKKNFDWIMVKLRRMLKEKPNYNKNDVYGAVGQSLFYLATGVALTPAEVKTVQDFCGNTLGILAAISPAYFNFFLLGGFLSRGMLKNITDMEWAFKKLDPGKGVDNAPMKAMLDASNEWEGQKSGIPEEQAMRSVTSLFLVNCFTTSQILLEALKRMKSEGAGSKYVKAFVLPTLPSGDMPEMKTDEERGQAVLATGPYQEYETSKDVRTKYIRENARLLPTPNTITDLSPEAKDIESGRKKYKCPAQTPMGVPLALANIDPEIFGGKDQSLKRAFEFDPERENLLELCTWNGRERQIMDADKDKRPPRYCPGHEIVLNYVMPLVLGLYRPK